MRDRHYPWRVLVCCALLNRTGRAQVRAVFEAFFAAYPEPRALLSAGHELADLLRPLGMQHRRAALLRRLTEDVVAGRPPAECHGVGPYAMDALAIFVEGRTDVRPSDGFLRPYLTWRKRHGTEAKEA